MIRLVSWAFVVKVVYANCWTWFSHVLSLPIWLQGQDHSAFMVVFLGKYWGIFNSPFWTGLLQNKSQKATCQEEHGALHSALSRAAPCLPPASGDLCLSLGPSCWAFVLLTGNTFRNWKRPVYPLAHLNADRLMPWLFKVMAVSRTDA